MYRGLSLERIVELANVADVVGMSVMFSQDWPIANKLITDLKIKLPDSIFVIGGEHGTAEPHGALRDCIALDYVVSGEGEHVFTELLNAIESNSSIIEISGITHRYNNVICQTLSAQEKEILTYFLGRLGIFSLWKIILKTGMVGVLIEDVACLSLRREVAHINVLFVLILLCGQPDGLYGQLMMFSQR